MVEIALQKARRVCFLYASVGGLVSCPQSSLLKALCKKNFWITPVEEFFFEVFSVFSSKGSFEEFVHKSLQASPFTKPLFTPGGWHEVKCVYWKVSVGLKFVCKSSAESQFFKSFGLTVYGSIQERRLCFRYFSRTSNCGVVFISLLSELSYFLSTDISYWKNVIHKSFPNERFCVASLG